MQLFIHEYLVNYSRELFKLQWFLQCGVIDGLLENCFIITKNA